MMIGNVLLLIGSIILFTIFLRMSINSYRELIRRIKNNKEFREKQEQVKKYKQDGNLHEWITITVNSKEGVVERTVCKNTGYCPSINGFYPMSIIQTHIALKKQEEEYAIFKEKRLKELSYQYNIAVCLMEQLANDVFSIKKDYTVSKMDEFLKELEAMEEKNE